MFGTLGSVSCASRGHKQWVGFLLGSTLSILGLFIIKWFFKDNPVGMSDFYLKKHIEELKEIEKGKLESEKTGISEKDYWEKKNLEKRKHDYENRPKWIDRVSPFGDEGIPDKHGNTWVDYTYYVIVAIIIIVSIIVFNLK
jgi:hypothetical protein